jgi:prepilin-type N-terminal cleavage/methylation domain-containing protein
MSPQLNLLRSLENRAANNNVAARRIALGVAWRGFTVIELMLVIVIIGILSLLASASYDRYIEKTRVYKAVSDIGAL